MMSFKMKSYFVTAICCGLVFSAYLGAEEAQTWKTRIKGILHKDQSPHSPQSPANHTQELADLQARVSRLEAENEKLRTTLQAEREKNLKIREAFNSLQRIAAFLGIKFSPETTVSRLESDIRIKLDSKCYVPQKRLSPSQLGIISDLLADEPALFHIIEIYHRFIISLDAGRLIQIPDVPRGNP